MPYGRGQEAGECRMVSLGGIALDGIDALSALRTRFLGACRTYADRCWPDDPTLPIDGKALDRLMLGVQAEFTRHPDPAIRLSSKWAEKARIAVAKDIKTQCARVRKTFFGRLANADATGDVN